jgi:hypothetical protein
VRVKLLDLLMDAQSRRLLDVLFLRRAITIHMLAMKMAAASSQILVWIVMVVVAVRGMLVTTRISMGFATVQRLWVAWTRLPITSTRMLQLRMAAVCILVARIQTQ